MTRVTEIYAKGNFVRLFTVIKERQNVRTIRTATHMISDWEPLRDVAQHANALDPLLIVLCVLKGGNVRWRCGIAYDAAVDAYRKWQTRTTLDGFRRIGVWEGAESPTTIRKIGT